MIRFDWPAAREALKGFGGEPIGLTIRKTGLPFFDTLRLYGAIDLYIGVREDVAIGDEGDRWVVHGRSRRKPLGRPEAAFAEVWGKKRPIASEYCEELRRSLEDGQPLPAEYLVPVKAALSGVDAALQSGIRDTAAADYSTLQTGQTSKSVCFAKISLADGLLAFAGKKRTETVGNILFLPLFQGNIDLSKVVSPLRAWLGVPNVVCCQAIALLALKNSLFAEGYQDRLTGVVFNTNLAGQRSDNFSGLVAIGSTAVGKIRSAPFVGHLYDAFRRLVWRAWTREGQIHQPDALAMAHWVMQPTAKHLSTMIGAQERLHRDRFGHILVRAEHVWEVFHMSYGDWTGDHNAVRRFARAVASAIYHARIKGEQSSEDRRKVWYDEVTMLRSAPSAKAFVERAMILIEQGHREHSLVGTVHREEAFDPEALLASIGKDRGSFETFRDLFRMYLVQESTYSQAEQVQAGAKEEVSAGESEAQPEMEEEE